MLVEDGLDAATHHEGNADRADRSPQLDHACRCSARWTRSTAACRAAWRSWPRSARPRRSSGLFGTVWGIYHALTAIGIAGQASIDKVAGPVGEALIMTAIGLAVAVPAVLGYNWLMRRNKVGHGPRAQLRRPTCIALLVGGERARPNGRPRRSA